jgi:hypothetical protein
LEKIVPAQRKTRKQKELNGTLRESREAARSKPSNPLSELEDAREALEAMKQNMRAATQQISAKGLMVTTQIADSHGKFSDVLRINPAIKVQREAMRAITSLKRQISQLEEEINERDKEKQQEEGKSEFAIG